MSVQSTMMETGDTSSPATIRVWDPLVRIFHWTLVALFAFAFLTGDEWEKAHITAGYMIAALVAVRVVWGFVGSRYARFVSFVRGPRVVLGYLQDTARVRARRHIGHNPAGGAMVVALLCAITIISVTGYMMTTNQFWGVEWVEDVHEGSVFLTLGLIVLHVVGVVIASLEHKENLVRSMVTGSKRAPTGDDVV